MVLHVARSRASTAALPRPDNGPTAAPPPPESRPAGPIGYRPALDGVRALAIGLVLVEHTGLEVFDGGNSGVVLFFVLSGFLITKLMAEEWGRTGSLDVRAFYRRRSLRIMPAPLVLAAVAFAAGWWLTPTTEALHYLWFELVIVVLYLTNLRPLLFGDGAPGDIARLQPGQERYFAHTWSLSIEEHFYLVWPWVLRRLRLPERPAVTVVRGLAGVAVAITVARWAMDRHGDPDGVSFSVLTFDGFAWGAALAFAVHGGTHPRLRRVLASTPAVAVALAVLALDLVGRKQPDGPGLLTPQDQMPFHYWYYTTIGLVGVVLITHLHSRPASLLGQLMAWRPVVIIGRLSYSIYLWHVPIQVAVSRERFPGWPLWRLVLVEQGLTVMAAVASYRLVEQPARRWRFRRPGAPRVERGGQRQPAGVSQ